MWSISSQCARRFVSLSGGGVDANVVRARVFEVLARHPKIQQVRAFWKIVSGRWYCANYQCFALSLRRRLTGQGDAVGNVGITGAGLARLGRAHHGHGGGVCD